MNAFNFKNHENIIRFIIKNITKNGFDECLTKFLKNNNYRLWLTKENNNSKEFKFSLAFGNNPFYNSIDGNYQTWDFNNLIFKHLTIDQIKILLNLNKL